MTFFPNAQAPGGSLVLASAAEKLAGSATALASNATFTRDITRMVVPHPCEALSYIAAKTAQASQAVLCDCLK
jgi:hypothetical protein